MRPSESLGLSVEGEPADNQMLMSAVLGGGRATGAKAPVVFYWIQRPNLHRMEPIRVWAIEYFGSWGTFGCDLRL